MGLSSVPSVYGIGQRPRLTLVTGGAEQGQNEMRRVVTHILSHSEAIKALLSQGSYSDPHVSTQFSLFELLDFSPQLRKVFFELLDCSPQLTTLRTVLVATLRTVLVENSTKIQD